jgi:hypothetical protein
MSTSTASNLSPQPGTPDPAALAPPATFDSSVHKMLANFGGDRELSLSTLLGAALLRLGTIDNSVASIAGAAGGTLQKGLAVTVTLDSQAQKTLDTLSSSVSTDERDLAAAKQKLTDTERRVARLEEHLGHLRAHCDALMSGAAEVTEKVAVIQRDHDRVTEELAAISLRIEPLERRKKGS